MDTQGQNTVNARARLEDHLEEGQQILEVTSLSTLTEIRAYHGRICEWRNAAYALLQDIYDHQSIQGAFCPTIEIDLEMQDEACHKLKAEVSMMLDNLRDLLSKCD
jgi:hypothetical protein